MPDILHDFPIAAPIERVFDAVATPGGLACWWAAGATGTPALGEIYDLDFGPGYQWRARVTELDRPARIEWSLTQADADWTGTRVALRLAPRGDLTQVEFRHLGWPEANAHFRTSSYCWAMYLRLLKRYLEVGEVVPYPRRLDV